MPATRRPHSRARRADRRRSLRRACRPEHGDGDGWRTGRRYDDRHSSPSPTAACALRRLRRRSPTPRRTALAGHQRRCRPPAGDGSSTPAVNSATARPAPALAHYRPLADARTVHNRYIEGAAIVSACSLGLAPVTPSKRSTLSPRPSTTGSALANTARAAHDTAQPRRALPAPQRTRSTRRTSRRRGPRRRPDVRRGGGPSWKRAHLGEHPLGVDDSTNSPQSAPNTTSPPPPTRRSTPSTHYCGEQARQATNRRSQSAHHTRCGTFQRRTHTSWNRVVYCSVFSQESGTQPRIRELGTERVARAASPSRATAAAVHDSGPAAHTTPRTPRLCWHSAGAPRSTVSSRRWCRGRRRSRPTATQVLAAVESAHRSPSRRVTENSVLFLAPRTVLDRRPSTIRISRAVGQPVEEALGASSARASSAGSRPQSPMVASAAAETYSSQSGSESSRNGPMVSWCAAR